MSGCRCSSIISIDFLNTGSSIINSLHLPVHVVPMPQKTNIKFRLLTGLSVSILSFDLMHCSIRSALSFATTHKL